ncbi:IS3 family transposase, partial [Sulfobacillus thermosulfidooxidans]|uniref:IS3 family transposase n=1 Tax=Sulfobacillus thermosulfidooxidans TaxID=28034 RepID=UPI001180AE26
MNAFRWRLPTRMRRILAQSEGECWRNQVFQTLAEAYTMTAEWIRFYNERRM